MAAFVGVAANVRPLHPAAVIRRYPAAGVVAPGQLVYLKSDGNIELADADAVASAQAIGIVVSIGSNGAVASVAGDMCDVCVWGPVTGFASMTIGAVVYTSVTAGSMDQTVVAGSSGDFPFIIGYAESAATIFVSPQLAVPAAA
jgi:hypothetical protein